MTKKKKPQDPREPNVENVAIDKGVLSKVKEHKAKTGISIRYFVESAILKELKNLEVV